MGIDLLEIGVKMRKVIIFTVRGCYRLVCNHPFLVGMLCFLIFLYRSCPVIFSLLVSASPVLVCTAVLLGTLLSFGQPNLPEIEIEEKTAHEAVSLKTGVSSDANATVVEKNESHYVERYSESKRDEPERANSSYGKEVSREVGLDDSAPLIDERSREVELDGGDLRYEDRTELNEERFSDGDVMESKYASIANMDDDDDEKAETESFDSEKVNVDSLDSPPRSPWTRIHEPEEEEEEDEQDDVSDSESDGAESSSPDASMADIMPMLDELHPLLDENAPQTVPMSRDGSPRSRIDGHDHSDDGSENHDNLDGPDDDNDDEEDKEEPTKSAITWTEEDQKNLMDLGCSEIERNIRLENLIMRRRARKNKGTIHERNLIDLESSDFLFNIAPITTRRQNPFDSPHDAYDENLPPIPGSAPSILLPRRNPFDIPYDSSEEKPDLKGDGFQEEFTRNQTRDSFFRRHESFNIRPSVFSPNRRDVRMRPYFVPEGTVYEESSYSFQRQSSELSDYSKVSSVPETESIGSVEDLEERNLDGEQNQQELDVGPEMKVESEAGPSRDLELISQEEENYEDLSIVEEKREFVEISAETFVTSIDQSIASTLVDVHHMEPVYDLSPRELSKNFSSSTISSDFLVEPSIVDPDEDESRPLDVPLKSSLEVPSSRADENIQVSEYQLTEEYSIINETVQSQNFDADNDSNEKLVFASSTEENSSFIFDNAIEERNLKHVDEVEVSNTSVDLFEDVRIQNLNMSEIQELDREISFNINSPLNPEFITIPSNSSEKITSRVDFQTIVEESNDITEIDGGLLSELDTVGDFSISTSNAFAKHTDSVEVNEIENQIHTENLGMAEVEARTVEEIDSAFEQTGSTEIEKPILWDPPQSEVGPSHEASTLELGPIEEVSLVNKDVRSDDHILHVVESEEAQETSLELHGEEPVGSESTFLPLQNTVDVKTEEEVKPTSDDVSLEIEAQGISSELLVKEPVYMESTNLPLDEVVDGDKENQVKPNSDYLFEESKKDGEISAVEEGSSSELLVEEQVSNVNTNSPSEEVVNDNIEDQVTTNSDDVTLEITKDEEISAIAFEGPEKEVEAQGTSSELLVEEIVPREITNLPLEEVIDGNMEKHVKPVSDDVFEHTKLNIEQGTSSESDVEEHISSESTDLPAEEVVDGNTENKVKPHYDDDQSVEIKKDEEISTVESEQAELKEDWSGSLVAGPVSKESTNLPLEEAIDGDTEKLVKTHSEDVSLEITKDREISTGPVEKPEHIEEPVPRESTNLPSQEVVDGNRENQVKPNCDDVSVEIKTDNEVNIISSQDLHLASSVKGKGKLSKSSSSSSSSSSESSSDSDRE